MEIYYGIEGHYIDVTYKCHVKLKKDNIITIPSTDIARARVFGDPIYGKVKHIKYKDRIYKDDEVAKIRVVNKPVYHLRDEWWRKHEHLDVLDRLKGLHQYICLDYGSMNDELPEQEMSVKFIKNTDVVLEIGGNIGRNSCVISTILNDDKNLVVLESNPTHADELIHNRDINGFKFHVEPSALSKVELIQSGWDTIVKTTPEIQNGYIQINTITWDQLRDKYKLNFNVLVADCEGALYQILKDEPSLLNNIETVIIENDFTTKGHKEYVDNVFESHGLKLVYNKELHVNIKRFQDMKNCFFQVFKKQ